MATVFPTYQSFLQFHCLWVRLPELPSEFYDGQILKKIGNAIGQLLKVDICTQDAKRGQYARLCIQVPLEQSLITAIYISKFHQKIQYEGINLLCSLCGRIGHYASQCSFICSYNSSHNSSHTHSPQISKQSPSVMVNSLHTTHVKS